MGIISENPSRRYKIKVNYTLHPPTPPSAPKENLKDGHKLKIPLDVWT